ncbi:MAG TPA: efflux RND transporter periplasmic adaptor subunit [Candidatus Paceibacterota bacterium]|jgi:multidrug efflux pump subunit AcrA (membrane-fusion protein)|nr:efflux RND transporter periplasmic adaptor subunit [Candidatus Paceibacterota bacterium]
MKKILNFIKKYKKSAIGVGIIILLGLIYLIFGRGGGNSETFTVARADVSQSVILSGKVQTTDRADLGFAGSGRLSGIFVKNNQTVGKGAVLAQLEIGDLLADLKIKQANLTSANVDIEAAKNELDRVARQEDEKVESAYRELLSEGLVLVPDTNDYDITAPTISGIYDGQEGQYKINIDKDGATSQDSRILTFGLEKTREIINKESSTRLGTKGLYISFPSNDSDPYLDTIWYLNIPNKASSSYLANFNAYNEAKKNRDLNVQNAEFKYKKLITEGNTGGSAAAQAEVQKINAEIRKNTIYAPFSGKVTNIEKEVGENASVGERVISILGENQLEIVLQVSELDVSRLTAGTPVTLKLDAIPGEEFVGTLQTINSRDTEIEGVPVYEAFVEVKPDPRIKTGMTATGTIVLAVKPGVLAIPNYFVKKSGDKNIVQVADRRGKTLEREVTLGLVGTDSMVEVVSGLSEGEKIVGAKE